MDKKAPKLEFLQNSRTLVHDEDQLIIGSCGGSSKIKTKLNDLKFINKNANEKERFDKMIVVTDHDDEQCEKNMLTAMEDIFQVGTMRNNVWKEVAINNFSGDEIYFDILLVMIPIEKCGAMETLLLESIASRNVYDKNIIYQCNQFIDKIDENQQYLKRRRDFVKAKFNTYFSIRVPEDFYTERQKLFQSFEWENYPYLKGVLSKLGDLVSNKKSTQNENSEKITS